VWDMVYISCDAVEEVALETTNLFSGSLHGSSRP